MSVQKLSGGRYRARIKDHGIEAASKVFDRHADAKRWEAEQYALLASGALQGSAARRMKLGEFFPRFVEARIHRAQRTRDTDLGAWRRYIEPEFGRVRIADISDARIRRWIGRLLSGAYTPGRGPDGQPLAPTPKSEGTAKRALGTLSAILTFAVEEHIIIVNPAHSVAVQQGANSAPRATALEREQLDELYELALELEGADSRPGDRPQSELIPVLGYTGLRWGELAGLKVSDLSTKGDAMLRVNRTLVHANGGGVASYKAVKGYLRREVPIPDPVREIVEQWSYGAEGAAPLFPGPRGYPLNSSNWRRRVAWNDACRAIGFDTLRPHDLRHTCATMYLKAGVNPKIVQRILGHADVQTTLKIYSHVSDRDIHDAARVFGRRDEDGRP